MEKNIKLLAKFFDKERIEEDPDVETLWKLDSIWVETHNNCSKRKMSPYKCAITANEVVIAKVLEEKL